MADNAGFNRGKTLYLATPFEPAPLVEPLVRATLPNVALPRHLDGQPAAKANMEYKRSQVLLMPAVFCSASNPRPIFLYLTKRDGAKQLAQTKVGDS